MKQAASGLTYAFRHGGAQRTFLVSLLLLLLGYFALANGDSALQVLSFSSLSIVARAKLFLIAFFDMTELLSPSILFLVIGATIFSALVVTLFSVLLSVRKGALVASGMYAGFALTLAILGVGCAACGAVLLSAILGFFGIGGLLAYFPYHGVEVGYLGLLLLVAISYTLSRRLANPYTC